jgi:transcriptional regulator with PAS, ATPase and Fis domain
MSEKNVLRPEDFLLRSVMPGKNLTNDMTLEEMEKYMINLAIDKNRGNLSAVAEQLGISRQTLYNKMKKFGQ